MSGRNYSDSQRGKSIIEALNNSVVLLKAYIKYLDSSDYMTNQ